jgi:hypothetical protein
VIFALTHPGFGPLSGREIKTFSPELPALLQTAAGVCDKLDGVFIVCFEQLDPTCPSIVGDNWLWAVSARYALMVFLLPR